MKSLVLASVLALSLAGCATTGGPSPTEIEATVKKVKETTAKVCGYVPTTLTIGKIITTFTGGGAFIDIARQVAGDICTAVTTAPLADGGTRHIVVRGVVVKGSYVRR